MHLGDQRANYPAISSGYRVLVCTLDICSGTNTVDPIPLPEPFGQSGSTASRPLKDLVGPMPHDGFWRCQ